MSNKRKILIAVIILLILVVCFLVGRAYAKSASQIKGSGNAQIAKWDFKVNGETTQVKAVTLKDTNNKETLTEGKIAPGTKGFFEIIVDTTDSQVDIDYEIKFENETTKPSNLIFKCGEVESSSIKNLESMLKGRIKKDDEEKIKIFAIEWEWKYQTGSEPQVIQKNDELDTKEGLQLTNYAFDIIVTGTQSVEE